MIYVEYYYLNKSTNKWVSCTNTFTDCVKALRFIKKIQKKDNYCLTGYRCDYVEDYEYLARRVTIFY